MFHNILSNLRAIPSAMKAGKIVGKCQREHMIFTCQLDEENHEIIPCFRHEEEIARLAEINANA